ncbi:glycine/betaine ABC transporter permease [Sporosarcina sp. P37]|uniref:BCCT family transporter n=1 Tax=unclassified Sporosarcina TaxID=2647733 RepID=UPI0009BDFDF0|nr:MULTISPECIES: BCCT family transporter [unclassified Sporosarcina]ARD48317.1 glycine/betaine ABC transporter permease [Sporosarcina sp. P33]ARK24822.1 glycine/betaine ABC transporter permease [Sporosarcina sp. P37]PID19981.1 BCCT family transporter [Sporosarcina sp. P35]
MKRISKVFYITIVLIVIAVGYGVINPVHFESITNAGKALVASTFGWYYMLLMTALLLISIFMIFSPYGKIRLGKDTDRPQFATVTWIAMLFSAGMGIGLVFYGAAEPLSHYAVPATEDPQTPAAYKEAMRKTFLHYGLHIWSLYGMVALALAYFQFRKGQPGLISATLQPIFGDKTKGPLGTIIDVLAVFATAFGVATSLGLGAVQINAGLNYLFGFSIGMQSQIVIVTVVTILFIGSAWSGLSRGIRYLSNTNLILAVALLGLVLILGPTLLIMNMFTDSVGGYFTKLIDMSMGTAPLNGENRGWLDGWTIFYWAWWISWSPFVSMFIARVSKGRTIREFMAGVLLVPSFFAFLWFSTFGTTAIEMQSNGTADLASLNIEVVAFEMFNSMPFSLVLSLFAILLVTSFFITSADSATYVLGMQSTYGSLTPPNSVKVIWGIIVSTIALVLLSAGGLLALQNTIIIAALPFSFIIVLMLFALFKSMNEELSKMK